MTHAGSPSHYRAERGGFTLIEVIFALVILTVGILAVATLNTISIWQTRRGDDLTNSAFAAAQVLDAVSVLPFDSVAVGNYVDTVSFGPANYIVNWTVSDMSDSLATGNREIKRVLVLGGGGLTQTTAEQYELFIFKPGGS